MARLSVGRRIHSRWLCQLFCLSEVRNAQVSLGQVVAYGGGAVKAPVPSELEGSGYRSDSDSELYSLLPHAPAVSEQRLSHPREQLAMLLPVHFKAIAEYLCLLAKEDQTWGLRIHSWRKECA